MAGKPVHDFRTWWEKDGLPRCPPMADVDRIRRTCARAFMEGMRHVQEIAKYAEKRTSESENSQDAEGLEGQGQEEASGP